MVAKVHPHRMPCKTEALVIESSLNCCLAYFIIGKISKNFQFIIFNVYNMILSCELTCESVMSSSMW